MTVIPVGPTKAIAIEVRAQEGVDKDACRTGVLVYSVDTAVPTGKGPIRVLGSRDENTEPCSAAPTLDTDPSATQEYRDTAAGTTITAKSKDQDGSYHVTVTKT